MNQGLISNSVYIHTLFGQIDCSPKVGKTMPTEQAYHDREV